MVTQRQNVYTVLISVEAVSSKVVCRRCRLGVARPSKIASCGASLVPFKQTHTTT
jgi:hypothetical protein